MWLFSEFWYLTSQREQYFSRPKGILQMDINVYLINHVCTLHFLESMFALDDEF